jgi:hypothetical protein
MKGAIIGGAFWGAALVFAVSSTAHAQQPAQPLYGPDDQQWETRQEPWNGAPIRPGGELEGRINGWVWVGTAALVGGYALSFVGLDPRPGSIIPVVGPILSAAGAFDEQPWEDGQTAAMIISSVLQVGGILGIVLGALNPRYYVVYDAPVGSPPLYVRWVPGAPGADVGSSLRVDFF